MGNKPKITSTVRSRPPAPDMAQHHAETMLHLAEMRAERAKSVAAAAGQIGVRGEQQGKQPAKPAEVVAEDRAQVIGRIQNNGAQLFSKMEGETVRYGLEALDDSEEVVEVTDLLQPGSTILRHKNTPTGTITKPWNLKAVNPESQRVVLEDEAGQRTSISFGAIAQPDAAGSTWHLTTEVTQTPPAANPGQ